MLSRVPSLMATQDYRVELSGILGILILTSILCKHYNITEGKVHIRCDNEASLRVLNEWYIPSPTSDSFDLTNAIWHQLKASPLTWTGEWIEGHQDDLLTTVTDRFALLNIEMDALAATYRLNLMAHNPNYTAPQISIQSEGWSIWCGQEKLHSPSKDTLYDRIYAPKIINYWTTSHYLQASPRIDPAAALTVDWDAAEALMKALPARRCRWSTKHGSENSGGLGVTAKRWRTQDNDKCPCCPAPEDSTHILRCSAPEFATAWTEHMETLTQSLTDLDFCPHLCTAISSRITEWRNEVPFTNDPSWSPQLITLLQSQDSIGWKNLMEGLPSTSWVPYLKHSLRHRLPAPSPRRLLTRILKAIHTLAWSQWQYRNQYVHGDGNLRDKAAIQLLDSQIADEFSLGPDTLPPSDHHHFSECLMAILNRTPRYKRAWFLNVTSARTRHLRRQGMADEAAAATAATSHIIHWIRTGRLR